ncbi:MAG: transglycosylase domain-containing protein [Corynebacterium sp.]|nr:transglycosylase domain-containing protein [Corynebacterium sp.]
MAKKKSRKGRILGVLALLFALVIIAPFAAFGVAYTTITVPEPQQIVSKQVANIYASDGTTEIARLVPTDGNRENVSLDRVPAVLQQAVVAAEDREFFTNSGFSITGFGRALWGQLTGNESAGGGSTITQQYVKNAVVGNERSYERKVKELLYSIKMTREWSKEEILQAYLNTIYFGRNAYGVAAASQAYFGQDVSTLTFEQSAVLAAAIQRPSVLDPWVNRAESEARWNYVLDGMVDIGAITPEQRAAAVYPETTNPANTQAFTQAEGTNGLIKTQVINELAARGITESDIQTRGLRIYTTIDPKVQESVLKAVNNGLSNLKDATRAAVVSIDPQTGAVKGYYGGSDPNGWDYANAGMETGSTFKIFALAAGLQQGIPLTKIYSSAPIDVGGITINNSDGETCGSCSIAQALRMSLNTSFIRLTKDLTNGAQDVADMAHNLGVARSLPGIPQTLTEGGNGDTPYETITLGMYQSRPLDMASGLSTLANKGVYHEPYFVSKVETSDGQVLYEHDAGEGERRVGEDVASDVIQAMLPIAAYSNNNQLANSRPSAAKTGTVQLGNAGSGANRYAWMIGATPQLATAVWMGTDDGSALTTSWGSMMYGSNTPSTIWKQTMDGALADEPVLQFERVNTGSGYSGSYYSGGTGNSTQRSQSTGNANSNTGTGTGTGGEDTDSSTGSEGAADSGADAGLQNQAPAPAPAPEPAPAPGGVEILPGVVIPNSLFGR